MVRIAIDGMGGDHAPASIIEGLAKLSLKFDGQLLVTGDADRLRAALQRLPHDPSRLEIVPAVGAIPMDAKPRAALDAQPRASLPLAAQLVAQGQADALVSAGNTGAVVLACARNFERLPGVRRTALAAVFPTARRHGPKQDPFSLMLDVGANVRVEAQDLVAFAQMGAAYAAAISENPRPRVALLNNGTEANKGPTEYVEAYERLQQLESIEFIGNIEGLDIPRGTADVVVCDGFVGNVVLKMLEGVGETLKNLAKLAYSGGWTWKLALFLLSGGIRKVKNMTDWKQYGGAPILGFNHLCIKAHGRSTPRALANAVRVAAKAVRADMMGRLAELE